MLVQRECERGADPVVGVEADAVAVAGETRKKQSERSVWLSDVDERQHVSPGPVLYTWIGPPVHDGSGLDLTLFV
jgi:hypothetical protein